MVPQVVLVDFEVHLDLCELLLHALALLHPLRLGDPRLQNLPVQRHLVIVDLLALVLFMVEDDALRQVVLLHALLLLVIIRLFDL